MGTHCEWSSATDLPKWEVGGHWSRPTGRTRRSISGVGSYCRLTKGFSQRKHELWKPWIHSIQKAWRVCHHERVFNPKRRIFMQNWHVIDSSHQNRKKWEYVKAHASTNGQLWRQKQLSLKREKKKNIDEIWEVELKSKRHKNHNMTKEKNKRIRDTQ